MRIAVFGATGATGRLVIDEALKAGHQVIALAREARTDATIQWLQGDVRKAADVDRAVSGADAVVSAIGVRGSKSNNLHTEAMTNVLAAMKAHAKQRLVLVSGSFVDVPGDRKALPERIAKAVVGAFAKDLLADKQREMELLRASELDWTAARPAQLKDKPAGGKVRTSLETPPGMSIPRASLARFLVAQLGDVTFVKKAPFVAG